MKHMREGAFLPLCRSGKQRGRPISQVLGAQESLGGGSYDCKVLAALRLHVIFLEREAAKALRVMVRGNCMTLPDNTSAKSPKLHSHLLFRRGLGVSLVYIIGLMIYAWFEMEPMLAMKPDQFATFLSGVFAPLAFLWLVLGTRQQGDELQNSALALQLQGEELRNSVEQQRQLVDATREQLHLERDVLEHERAERARLRRPLFRARPMGGSTNTDQVHRDVSIENQGTTCTNLIANLMLDGDLIGSQNIGVLEKGHAMQLGFWRPREADINGSVLTINYIDRDNYEGSVSFTLVDTSSDGDFFAFHFVPIDS